MFVMSSATLNTSITAKKLCDGIVAGYPVLRYDRLLKGHYDA